MVARLLQIIALALLAGSGAALADPPAPVAFTVTPITVHDVAPRLLAPHRGRALLVSAWASWCAPCLEELPGLLKLKKKLAKRGVDVVFLNADPPGTRAEALAAVLRRRGIALEHSFVVAQADPTPFLAAIDPAWNGAVPYHAIFRPDGTRSAGLVGARPLAEIELALLSAFPGTPTSATPATPLSLPPP
ncbi:MAG: TlpA family protein disulfide reductase [Deltaproteobacteria bacterium]|nr:TlpA family protein disulfide reductase [Deltaproteobacteria bacterium]